MKPRIRTAPHRIAVLAIAAGVPLVALPAAANAAVTPSINGNTLTLTGDATDENITLGVDDAGLITHSFGRRRPDQRDRLRSRPRARRRCPSNGTITVVLNAGGGNDNVNLSAPNLAGRDDQRRRRATT